MIQLLVWCLVALVVVILSSHALQLARKRQDVGRPAVSFVIACYNEGHLVKNALRSIVETYKDNGEIIIVNDASTDDSLMRLREMQKTYTFRLINNPKNIGAAASWNKGAGLTRSRLFFIVDCDVVLRSEVVVDLLCRISDRNVGAVSAPYLASGDGVLVPLQGMDYAIQAWSETVLGKKGILNLYGGCMVVKKEAFQKVGGFTVHAINQDRDIALKLKKKGYLIDMSTYFVESKVPANIPSLIRQRKRWSAGGTQSLLTHFSLFISNPVYPVFIILYCFLSAFFTVSLGIDLVRLFFEPSDFALTGALLHLSFGILAFPFTLPLTRHRPMSFFLPFVFTFVYLPILSVFHLIGLFRGLRKHFALSEGSRGW
jgi:cellulose synthase/poly-beta-1,6-N-acetylglucosamine synthase-like glycosyltransferase